MSAEVSQVRTYDSATDKYDHAIILVDSTLPGAPETPQLTSSGSWRRLARIPTKTSVKDQISRRKYASWRKDKYDGDAEPDTDADADEIPGNVARPVSEPHPEITESAIKDFGKRPDTTEAEVTEQPKPQKGPSTKKQKEDHEIEVLFENQRGSFFCGIPLYSHSSLLNFDPAAWVTRDFKNSPVNITNAQVPDPSWIWAWKTWYVDMSDDVDEEGWQYSFSFGRSFAWHGTHPWFHSFVRRRCWLRKRVKRSDPRARPNLDGSLEAAHHLNADYFTIHSKSAGRNLDEASNPEAQLARPESFTSYKSVNEELKMPEEIKDIPSLMRALKVANVDRAKVDAVKEFISIGGDELIYLEERMSEIMSTLVFQNSRRQILQSLKDQAEEAQQHRDQHDAEHRPEGPNEKRRIDNLLRAAEAANKEIQGLEYWSDRKHVLQTEDEAADDDERLEQSVHGIGEIRGISEKAQTSKEIQVDRRLVDKGKQAERTLPTPEREKDVETKDDGDQKGLGGKDSVLIPNDESATDD